MQELKQHPRAAQNQQRRADPDAKSGSSASDIGETAFLTMFEEILVGDPAPIEFDGSLSKSHMKAIWRWLKRDIAPDIAESVNAAENVDAAIAVLTKNCSLLLQKASAVVSAAAATSESERRLVAQLGGEDVRHRIPVVLSALRCLPLLAKATAFGRAANSIPDDASLGTALQSMPLREPKISALLFHTIVGQSASPSRLILSVAHITGGASEAVLIGAGFEPLVDALFAHAQNQVALLLDKTGPFADVDLMCKAMHRFHRLMRAATSYTELERGSRWGRTAVEITSAMARIIEPRLREVSADVSQSMRKPRNGADRVDSDRLFSALNGIYLLSAVREARESLALNALFDKIWGETGQSLEILIERNLEDYKKDASNQNVSQRLDMGIKMAEIRFGAEYAEILQRAKDSVERRIRDAV